MVAVLTRSLLASHQPIVAGVRTVEQAPAQSAAALADALTSLRWEQKHARERLGQLDELTVLLMAGVTTRTITLASEPLAPSKGTT